MKNLALFVMTRVTAVGAAQFADAREPRAKSTYNPEQIVCSRDRETGSRVIGRRVCMPARDWERFHREQRQAIDRVQTNRVHPQG
ncbi:MAG TPA: hypothetical protein VLK25_06575 [Allosphingosinicella sp.]|nr:hypothetical protein [Allosphingosinicella sp.]